MVKFEDSIDQIAAKISSWNESEQIAPEERIFRAYLLEYLGSNDTRHIRELLPLVNPICLRIEYFADQGPLEDVSEYFTILESIYNLRRSPGGVSISDGDLSEVIETVGAVGMYRVNDNPDFVLQLIRRLANLEEGLYPDEQDDGVLPPIPDI